MNGSRLKLLSVFLVSTVIIGYELAVMRVFAVGSWATFGSMIISIALLGFGLAGTILTFIQKRLEQNADKWMGFLAICLPVAMALGHVLAQQVPFNPKYIAQDAAQLWMVGAYFVIYAIPFVCAAFFIGVAFIALSSRIHELYFWNMAGSGIGGFFILGVMYFCPPGLLSIPLFALSAAAAFFCFMEKKANGGGYSIKPRYLAAGAVSLAASILLLVFAGGIRVSPEKSISLLKKFPEYKQVLHTYSPAGEIDLFESSFFHSAPGMSDSGFGDSKHPLVMPRNAFMGLYIDGAGPIQIMRKLDRSEEAFINYLPMAAAYQIREKPRTLVIRAGGGLSAFTALHFESPSVTIAESSGDMLHLLGEEKVVTDFNGNLFRDPRVHVVREEPRAHARASKEQYDLVEISLIDSIGLNDDGGYTVAENFTYTVEGITDYMNALAPGGILSLTVWNNLAPPRNVLRLITTAYNSLEYQGVKKPSSRMVVFDDLFKTATILLKKDSDFTAQELSVISEFCRTRSFEECWFPGMSPRAKNFDAILETYNKEFYEEQNVLSESLSDELANPSGGLLDLLEKAQDETDTREDLLPGDLYHFTVIRLGQGREQELYSKYIFDIRPATDDRPYYTAYMKPESTGMVFGQISKVASEWGYILLLGTLFQSILFGALIILIPLIGRRKELFSNKKGTFSIISYYACLGLAYMLVEIFLIQKLVFFLADPIFSTSIVISAMLVISGLGSLFSSRLSFDRTRRVRIAVMGIAICMVFYMTGLSPLLQTFLGAAFPLKVIMTVILIAPAAFFMGIPFPTGLDALGEKRSGILPWAWGTNGALSVTGAAIARLFSVSFGFTVVLAGAAALYILAGIIYPANENKG